MIDLVGMITYRDGGTRPIESHQSEFAAWERYALRQGYPVAVADLEHPGASITMIRYLGYAAAHAGTPQGEWPSFDVWEAGVVDVALAGVDEAGEAGAVPPTLQVASDGSSPA